MPKTLRNVMHDRFMQATKELFGLGPECQCIGLEKVEKFVEDLVSEAFSVCGIPEKEQDEPW